MKAIFLFMVLAVTRAQTLLYPETLGLTLFQSFFDNLTANFIAPLINTLPQRNATNLFVNKTLDLVDFISFDFNVTQLTFPQAALDPTTPIIQLGENKARFQINLTLEAEFDYQYISDPPIFADIGTAYLGFDGMFVDFTWTSTMDDSFVIEVSNVTLDFAPDQPHPLFDGISDFSILASNVATTVTAIIRNRLQSLINAQLVTPKLNKIVNKIV
jgi:hypothetical protein